MFSFHSALQWNPRVVFFSWSTIVPACHHSNYFYSYLQGISPYFGRKCRHLEGNRPSRESSLSVLCVPECFLGCIYVWVHVYRYAHMCGSQVNLQYCPIYLDYWFLFEMVFSLSWSYPGELSYRGELSWLARGWASPSSRAGNTSLHHHLWIFM